MKTTIYHLCFLVLIQVSARMHAQTNVFPSTGAAGIGTTSPDPSSLLEIVSTSKGMLIPRMTKTQRDAIVTPSTGLLIFQTNSNPGFYYYNGSTWTTMAPAGVTKTLSNLTSPTAVNQSLVPGATNAIDLGSSSILWRNAYFSGDALINGLTVGLGGGGKSTNTSVGFQALFSNSTGNSNTANGNKALYSNTTGQFNTAYGLRALYSNTTGYSNVAIGIRSLYSNQTSSNLVAVGDSALYNNTATFNTAIGSKALYANTTGIGNVALGWSALQNNTIGVTNTAIGTQALDSNTTGVDNVANGVGALFANTTGNNNTAMGSLALSHNRTGNDNTAVGTAADVTDDNLNNTMALGYLAIVNASNKVVVGNTSVSVIGGQVGWSTFSDGRFKTNIKDNVPGLVFINKLKPVTYNIESQKFEKFLGRRSDVLKNVNQDRSSVEKKIRTGFIAQDVEKSAQEIGYDFDGVNHPQNEKDNYSLVYTDFVPSLVKAVQELSKQNEDLKKAYELQQKQIDELKALLISQNQQILDKETVSN